MSSWAAAFKAALDFGRYLSDSVGDEPPTRADTPAARIRAAEPSPAKGEPCTQTDGCMRPGGHEPPCVTEGD